MTAKRAGAVLLAVMVVAGGRAAADSKDTPIWRAQHGVLLGVARAGNRSVAVGDNGGILLSDDQGAHWRQAVSPTTELLTAVIFPTPAEGWAVGQDGVVLHSADAGSTWVQQHLAAGSDRALFAVVSLGGTHLFASGAYNLVLESSDGGRWVESKIPSLDDDYHLNCAVARGDDVYLTGEAGHAFIRHAGAWKPVKLPYDGSQFACLMTSDGSFYSFGLRGSAFVLPPGAPQWRKLDIGSALSIFGAALLGDGRMALVGANGTVIIYDPGPGRAVKLPPPTDKTLSGVMEMPGHQIMVAGEDGVHVMDVARAGAGL